jgi:hypothetical protein
MAETQEQKQRRNELARLRRYNAKIQQASIPTKEQLQQVVQMVKELPNVVKSPPNTVTHGMRTMYFAYNCRCAPCREAGTRYARERRQSAYANVDPDKIVHGKRYSYTNLGCRCDLCRRATLDYQAKYDKTPTGRAKINARRRAKRAVVRANRTPEQVEADRAKERERSKRRRAKAKEQTLVE